MLALFLCAAPLAHATDTTEAKQVFNQRCSACHTFGKGIKVGPDLKGVTTRRSREWLLQFVRSSQRLIDAGDPIAAELFLRFKGQRMPDWLDLSEAQIAALLDWLAANGPEQRELDERGAATATAIEIELGRRLFHGRTPLFMGGMACGSCHGIHDHGSRAGGTFGPDLTNTYVKYQDRLLTLLFRQPCFARLPESATPGFMLPLESFAIKAYLREASLPQGGTP